MINKFLSQTLGVNIVRARPRIKVDVRGIKQEENPVYIEFIGVSGVGKSFIYNHMMDKLEGNWLELKQFRNMYSAAINYKTTDSLSFYQAIAEHSLQTVFSSHYNALDKMRFITHFRSVLLADSLVYLYNEYKLISDEGLFHNCGDSVLAVATENTTAFEKLHKNRAFVYCYASAETIANRILERGKRTGDVFPQYKLATYKELLVVINKELQRVQNIVHALEAYNVPILPINTERSIKNNVKKIKEFVENIR